MSRQWEDHNLDPAILEGIRALGFAQMTPVQAAAIPAFINHKDVSVQACTGSGKTLSFLVPTIQILLRKEPALKSHQIGAIIISPTRYGNLFFMLVVPDCTHA